MFIEHENITHQNYFTHAPFLPLSSLTSLVHVCARHDGFVTRPLVHRTWHGSSLSTAYPSHRPRSPGGPCTHPPFPLPFRCDSRLSSPEPAGTSTRFPECFAHIIPHLSAVLVGDGSSLTTKWIDDSYYCILSDTTANQVISGLGTLNQFRLSFRDAHFQQGFERL
jgi:hypothetical protein